VTASLGSSSLPEGAAERQRAPGKRYGEAERDWVRPLLARQEGEAQPQWRILGRHTIEYVARIVDIDIDAALPAFDPREDGSKIKKG
jgi:hypothetical protein